MILGIIVEKEAFKKHCSSSTCKVLRYHLPTSSDLKDFCLFEGSRIR